MRTVRKMTEEFMVEVPYCKVCEKADIEAQKFPHTCCGDTLYSHVVKPDGSLVHSDKDLEKYGIKEGEDKWNDEVYHEFEKEPMRVSGVIVGLVKS